jgi:hypothetical protein
MRSTGLVESCFKDKDERPSFDQVWDQLHALICEMAADDDQPAPPEFMCPITMDLMIDPVVAADGFTYERQAIEGWLQQHDTSPKTNEPLGNQQLTPNTTLKVLIQDSRQPSLN